MEAGESPIFIKEVTVAIVTRQQKYPPLLLILLITSSSLLQSLPDGSDGAGLSLSRMEHPHWAMSSHQATSCPELSLAQEGFPGLAS